MLSDATKNHVIDANYTPESCREPGSVYAAIRELAAALDAANARADAAEAKVSEATESKALLKDLLDQTVQQRDAAQAAAAQERARAERLESVLRECKLDYEIMSKLPARAKAISVPEDPAVKSLCEFVGFGAVMDSASRQWYLDDGTPDTGAFCCGPCYGTVTTVLAQINAALAPASGDGQEVA